MSGIKDLHALLAAMSPALDERRFVFTWVKNAADAATLHPLATFQERESLTLVCPVDKAERAKRPYSGVYRLITLEVDSALDAVGFLAAVTHALAEAGIPANAMSAFYHDHVFVPEDKAPTALGVLRSLAQKHQA